MALAQTTTEVCMQAFSGQADRQADRHADIRLTKNATSCSSGQA